MAAGWFDSLITSDHAGGLTAVKFSTANGQVRGTYFLATPFQITTNPTLTSGSTNTYTCAGGGTGVPSGAVAVIINAQITSSSAGAYALAGPHGATLAFNYPIVGLIQTANAYAAGTIIVPLASSQIDVKAVSGNVVLQNWAIGGYII
jgi:hypothetical protein